jgi:hypothetical protein
MRLRPPLRWNRIGIRTTIVLPSSVVSVMPKFNRGLAKIFVFQ